MCRGVEPSTVRTAQERIQKVWLGQGANGGTLGAEVERRKRESSRAPKARVESSAVGAGIEALKAPKGVGCEEGVSPSPPGKGLKWGCAPSPEDFFDF